MCEVWQRLSNEQAHCVRLAQTLRHEWREVTEIISYMVDTIKKYEDQRIKEVLLYILSKTGVVDYYHLMKILYLAERQHLAKWGEKITTDDYYALPHGPVPTRIYDALKAVKDGHGGFLADVVTVEKDQPNVMPLREPDMGYLSKSEVEALDNAITKNIVKSFAELEQSQNVNRGYCPFRWRIRGND